MTNEMDPPASPLFDQQAEAAVWLARLRGPQRDASVERGLRRWLREDPGNALAFDELTRRLEVVERLKTRTLPARWRVAQPASRVSWRPVLSGVAAALTAVMVFGFIYLRQAGVATSVGEQRTMALEDGSRIYLNTASRVRVSYDDGSRRVELMSGEALFEVAKDASRPFVVAVADRTVTALGTTFVVRRSDAQVSVTLMEGKVRVASTSSEVTGSTVLAPGDRLTIPADATPAVDHPAMEAVTAWRRGLVALDGMSLSHAVQEMNRYSQTRLIIEQAEAQQLPVGGSFRIGDSASFAAAVAATYGLQVERRDDDIVIAGRPR
ncbi:FecR family protein [Steroidobacter sp.]|uniref:FecR family protein n=1 Tax=Steroidobacter sp. TaxID=1978227 RepID=UPI001A36F914|nr:FecR domain-containing protein [Steroidobacter sp.]MBL8270846.1 FecR domain-containing protein [Steroidobacter sp.]